MNTSSITADTTTDRFIIRYKTGSTERVSTAAVQSKLDRFASAFPARAHHLRRMGIGSDVVTTERKLNAREARAFMRAIASDPNVEYVEPDTEMSVTMTPNDPEYSSQWGLTSNQKPGVATVGIRAEGAWDVANGSGIVIAVVDNGVTSHGDLNANILPGYDFTSGNRGGNGMNPGITTEKNCSVVWHGTHVAGIAAALTNNGVGIAGIAPAARIVPVRVMNACGNGYASDIADGITWAAGGSVPGVPANPYPAKVINLSVGGLGMCEATFQNAIDYAISRGSMVAAAAGNNAVDASNFEPANCRGVVSVGGTNRPGGRWVNSNDGVTVDIAAPADSIWSTYNNGTSSPGTEGYTYMSGTSMAAPAVSGVMALAQSVAPEPLTPAEMRTLLMQNVQPFPAGLPDQPIGSGIVDAYATVIAARSGKIPASADFECAQSAQLMQLTCTNLSTARGSRSIRKWDWNFGDGNPDTVTTGSTNPVVNYDYPGTYLVTLTVTDTSGATSTVRRPVSVKPLLVTDLTDNDYAAQYGLNFPLANGEILYFSIAAPGGVRSLIFNTAWTTTFDLRSGSAKDVALLEVKGGTASMVSPDCSSVMTGGVHATCTGLTILNGGIWYARVTAKTAVNSASLRAFNTPPDQSKGLCSPGMAPC
ncbi:MAG: S8 family serine peptidase [Paraburkholderia sp.]